MTEEKEKKTRGIPEAEEVKEILGVVSKEVPHLIKGLMSSVFSEEAGRDMGKAAAAFYTQLKNAGIPEETAVKMTQDYMSAFTNLGSLLKNMNVGESKGHGKHIEYKIKDKHHEHGEEEENDDEEDDED